jgi:poly(A)-specific ribonuclease
MHLTRKNFDASFPEVEGLLKVCFCCCEWDLLLRFSVLRICSCFFNKKEQNAEFVAFDLEFSGLGKPGARQSFLDSIPQRFKAAFESTGNFFPLQLGFAVFSKGDAGWQATPISVHVIPSQDDRDFTIQASSIAYLAENGFDFQKSFALGVNWLSIEQEQKARKLIEEDRGGKDEIIVTEERDKKFVQSLKDLLVSPGSGSALLDAEFVHPEGFRDFWILKPVNRFLRRVAFETVAREDPLVVAVAIDERLALKRFSTTAEVVAFRAAQVEKQRQELLSRVGARRVLDCIAKLNIPVVGHNSLLDVLYLIGMVSKVSPDLEEFKTLCRKRFPGGLVDTKYVANQFPRETFKGTGLVRKTSDTKGHFSLLVFSGRSGGLFGYSKCCFA